MPEPPAAVDAAACALLGRLARAELVAAVRGGRGPALPPGPAPIVRPGASFVSLHDAAGVLRGCIGSIAARRPLVADVTANARAAALEDPRFDPVAAHELAGLQIEISLLSPLEPLAVASRDELLAALRPGADGLLLEEGRWRATFLPDVWEQLQDPERFLAHLERKAGLPAGEWSAARRAWRYTTTSFVVAGGGLSA